MVTFLWSLWGKISDSDCLETGLREVESGTIRCFISF